MKLASFAASLSALTATNGIVRRFFRWWGTALAALIPVTVRRWWAGAAYDALLSVETDRFKILAGTAGEQVLAQLLIDPDRPAEQGLRVAEAWAGLRQRPTRFALRLDPAQVLVQELHLPLAVEEGLGRTLAYELDRLTPFRREQVHFDYRIISRNTQSRQLAVEIAVVRRDLLDRLLSRARELGFSIVGVVRPTDGRLEAFRIAGLEAATDAQRSFMHIRWACLCCAILLACAAFAFPLWKKREQVIDLTAMLAQVDNPAREAMSRRDELDAMVKRINLLPERKWAEASALKILDELSRLLPTDTFLSALEFDGKSIQLQGESASASGLIGLLEASPLFANVAFKAPLVKIPNAGERFHIIAAVEPGTRHTPADSAAAPTGASAVAADAGPSQ